MAKAKMEIESTLDIKVRGRVIRLWLHEDKALNHYPRNDHIAKDIISFIEKIPHITDLAIISYIKDIKGVNAVQVQDQEGAIRHGTVMYLVPF